MSIPMQGAWTVSVKSKHAAFQQRFIIAGAASGNGTYAGETTTPPVAVTGAHWFITIQHNPGAGWLNSVEQLKFPAMSAGKYRFDIESNDTGPDKDFNDLILTCSTPVALTDFLIYGTLSDYSDGCIFNPCSPKPWLVIDSVLALESAIERPALKKPIETLYAEKVILRRPPLPDPPPFRPLVLPSGGQTTLPGKQALAVKASEAAVERSASDSAGETATAAKLITYAKPPASATLNYEAVAVAGLVDQLWPICQTSPMPGFVLRFQEYDRTAAELTGGAYTGTGKRENLGTTLTDVNGNFIFRFSRGLSYFLEEFTDVPPGGDAFQLLPDIIVQLMDPALPGGVIWESAPYWNVWPFRKINVCVPRSLGKTAKPCDEQLIIQKIGNIYVGKLAADGTRTGPSTYLDDQGRITNQNLYYGPHTQCAAWWSSLQLYACLKDPAIKFYTVRYRKPAGAWSFAKDTYVYYKYDMPVNAFVPVVIGPYDIDLHIDGGPLVKAKAYHNIQVDTGAAWLPAYTSGLPWLESDLVRKIVLTSLTYQSDAGGPGPVEFRIEGYKDDGTKFPGADDTITLYLNNDTPSLMIHPTVKMIGPGGVEQSFDNCALFTLPAGNFGAPIRIRFRANHSGFAGTYELYMNKGATGYFHLAPPPPPGAPYRTRSYNYTGAFNCTPFRGTLDDTTYDAAAGLVSVDVTPAVSEGGVWLDAGQPFCAFGIHLYCSIRVTNGFSVPSPYWAQEVLIGIKKP